jgi:hypothetical protein
MTAACIVMVKTGPAIKAVRRVGTEHCCIAVRSQSSLRRSPGCNWRSPSGRHSRSITAMRTTLQPLERGDSLPTEQLRFCKRLIVSQAAAI